MMTNLERHNVRADFEETFKASRLYYPDCWVWDEQKRTYNDDTTQTKWITWVCAYETYGNRQRA